MKFLKRLFRYYWTGSYKVWHHMRPWETVDGDPKASQDKYSARLMREDKYGMYKK